MADRIDLKTATFTQAQVLELIPELSAKTLQNWNERDILGVRPPGRKGKRRQYTGLGVIALKFMADVVVLGIQPGEACEIAQQFAERALEVHRNHTAVEQNGRLMWTIDAANRDAYRTERIIKLNGKHGLYGAMHKAVWPFGPHVYITVEVDLLVIEMLNAIYRVLAGHSLHNSGSTEAFDADGNKVVEPAITNFYSTILKAMKPPGGKE